MLWRCQCTYAHTRFGGLLSVRSTCFSSRHWSEHWAWRYFFSGKVHGSGYAAFPHKLRRGPYVTIFWRYNDTSISTSRRDGPERSGFPVTLGPDFLKFRIYKNSVFKFKTKKFSINRQKIMNKNFAGLRPALPPYGAAPHPPTKVNAKYLAAVVLDNLGGHVPVFSSVLRRWLCGEHVSQ